MDNQIKYLNDEKNNKKYRLIGGVFGMILKDSTKY